VEVTLSDTDYVLVRAEGTLSALLPNDVDVSQFKQTVELDAKSVEAPVAEGQVLGKVTLSYDGEDYGSLDLVALNDVERNELLYRIDRLEKFFGQTWVKVALVALAVLMVALIVLVSTRRRRRRRRTRAYMGYSGRRR
jgi:D-alanyl-D-alanine carboxypeptidase (penicillin-binding protein 5/6)